MLTQTARQGKDASSTNFDKSKVNKVVFVSQGVVLPLLPTFPANGFNRSGVTSAKGGAAEQSTER